MTLISLGNLGYMLGVFQSFLCINHEQTKVNMCVFLWPRYYDFNAMIHSQGG